MDRQPEEPSHSLTRSLTTQYGRQILAIPGWGAQLDCRVRAFNRVRDGAPVLASQAWAGTQVYYVAVQASDDSGGRTS